MSDKDLQDALRGLVKRNIDTFPASVKSVDVDRATCVVWDGELEYTDVRLSSVNDENDKKFIIVPAVGSQVLVSPIQEDILKLYVTAYGQIDALHGTIENTRFQIDKDGFSIARQNESLKKLMDDLIAAIRAMVFQTSQGPTTILQNDMQFEAIAQRVNNLLKD